MPLLKPQSKLEAMEWEEYCERDEVKSHSAAHSLSFQDYEKGVAKSFSGNKDLSVIHNHRVVGLISKEPRQIDVWIKGQLAPGLEMTAAVECKLHEKSKVGKKDIEAFLSVLEDVGANKGVFVTNTGFTRGAKARAQEHKLTLKIVTVDEIESTNWEDFFKSSSCKNPEGCYGLISWELEDEEGSEAGCCDACGFFHIHCDVCGELDWYPEQHSLQCSSCRNVWEFDGPHDEPFYDSMTLVQRESEMTD